MRSIHQCFALSALLALEGCAVPAFDHYDPVKLRAAAIEREAAGDAATARVLRERAARIAPHEPRAAPAPGIAPPPVAPALLPEPPALWPSR